MIKANRKEISHIEAADRDGNQRTIARVYAVVDGKLKLI